MPRARSEEKSASCSILTGHTLKDSNYTIDYHRGELFTEEENAQISGPDQILHAALRKPPVVLDPDPDTVFRELESQMKLVHA